MASGLAQAPGKGWVARLLVVAACGAAAAVVAPGTSRAAPARTCPTPKYPSQGYFQRITVGGGTTCATGSRLALAYYHCRTRTGSPAGRCAGGVLGYSCHEVRNSSSIQIAGRVTCRRRGATIVHVYLQNL